MPDAKPGSSRRSRCPPTEPDRREKKRQRDHDRQCVAEPDIRCHALPADDLDFEDAAREPGAVARISRPSWPIADVMPVLVARTSTRPVSSARIAAIWLCWSAASERPYHASLVTLTRSVAFGRLAADVGAEGILVADVDGHALAGDLQHRRIGVA